MISSSSIRVHPCPSVSEWILAKLEAAADNSHILLQDPLHLLPEADGTIHSFASSNGFTVIVASTNLVFRELYEKAIADPETKKLLVVDRAPARRRSKPSLMKAPPPFYPDFLMKIPPEARIDLDLRQFLKDTTGDPSWPFEANDPRYARLITQNMDGVLRSHKNLRTADANRFTDHDFKIIVAFAALGVAESAFKHLDAEDYWKIGLMGHKALEAIDSLAPEVAKPIRDELEKAPAPFCWFVDHDADTVLRVFYLSVILSQHFEHWNLLLANIDPALGALSNIRPDILKEAAPRLIRLDPDQADDDIRHAENSLTKNGLQLLLLDQLNLTEPLHFASVLKNEKYSTLFRSLALLLALDDVLSTQPPKADHETVFDALYGDVGEEEYGFIEKRASITWSHLKEAYALSRKVQHLRDELGSALKSLKVLKSDYLHFKHFQDIWNGKKINRLEYYVSALERLVFSGDLLPRKEDDLPSSFGNALHRIRQRVRSLVDEINKNLDELNSHFQRMVAERYPAWIKKDAEVLLTSQFLRRCLKPHWDPQTEKAVVLIFDGMRYDIWDEFLRPMLEDRMEILKDYPALSLLPSETHITRKAISAGTYPDQFDTHAGEDKLLKAGLAREFSFNGEVEVVSPDTMGTGETVRYRAKNLDVYIFELCDKELHKVQMKTLPDGRQVPSRPLAFIYQQHLKNIIDTEVMAIVRNLSPGTRVFIVADHGFGYVHRERVFLEATWLNHVQDCSYRNAWLRQSLSDVKAPGKVKANVWEFPVAALRMPAMEEAYDPKTKSKWQKQYASIVFPKTGYTLCRPGSHFNPDAYTHGGISIQELMIPMVALRVREKDEGILRLDDISGPSEAVEGQEVEFRMHLSHIKAGSTPDEIRVDVGATYTNDPERNQLQGQVLYVSAQGCYAVYRFQPDTAEATEDERRQGVMERTLTITVSYRQGQRTIRNSRTYRFLVRLNSERVVRRVPSHLGSILGLTPKSMR